MKNNVYLETWIRKDDHVELRYQDGSIVNVSVDDFNRAFGCIVSATKDAIVRDFAI